MTTVRMTLRMTDQMERRLTALALANTGGNRTAMITQLINRAFIYPSEFSLIPPEDAGITEEMITEAINNP